jgi:hypothetical protein
MLGSHISTCFNKDTRDFFMLCIMLVCPLLYIVLLLLFDLFSCCLTYLFFFVHVCLTFVSFYYFVRFNFHCFFVQREIFNSDPGLYSRYIDPGPVTVQHHHLASQ